jgi:hypothetical protein
MSDRDIESAKLGAMLAAAATSGAIEVLKERLRAVEAERDEWRAEAQSYRASTGDLVERAASAERWSTSLLPLVHATRDGIASGRLGKHLEHGCLCSLHQLLDRFTVRNDAAADVPESRSTADPHLECGMGGRHRIAPGGGR